MKEQEQEQGCLTEAASEFGELAPPGRGLPVKGVVPSLQSKGVRKITRPGIARIDFSAK